MKHLTTNTWQALLVMAAVVFSCNNVKQKVGIPPEDITSSKLSQIYRHDVLQFLPKNAFLGTGQVSQRFLATRNSLLNKCFTSQSPFIVAGPGVDGTIAERMEHAKAYTITHLACRNITATQYDEFVRELSKPKDDGAKYYENIQTLVLEGCQISDIKALPKLTKLKKLSLCSNRIANIEELAKQTNLEELNLRNNNITDIEALSALSALSAFSALPKLKKLYLLPINEEVKKSLEARLPGVEVFGSSSLDSQCLANNLYALAILHLEG